MYIIAVLVIYVKHSVCEISTRHIIDMLVPKTVMNTRDKTQEYPVNGPSTISGARTIITVTERDYDEGYHCDGCMMDIHF